MWKIIADALLDIYHTFDPAPYKTPPIWRQSRPPKHIKPEATERKLHQNLVIKLTHYSIKKHQTTE